ncbi:OmpP1/FadL family transporter [Helicobacter cinaedi]|uniref:Outer membrane transport protein P1 n=1 Tax=Helicobacter cinaedi TaxID=213 RepID=A0A377JP95_9HELI|nr:outer membrane protein transport protein [Helicobacter cinaedi]STP09599.1 outer membrane transport protein P1 [Helicobacter cinaedi]
MTKLLRERMQFGGDMRLMKIFYLICLCLFGSNLLASGFRLTEQSLNGTALNSAYIAGAYGADSTYYNPANMGLGEYGDKHELEIDASIIYIPAFEFDAASRDKGMNIQCLSGKIKCGIADAFIDWGQFGGKNGAIVDGYAKKTLQPVPKIFYKTRTYEILGLKTNFGLNFTTPSGLSMDWGGEAGAFLDDVMIMMMEFNPVVSFKLSDQVAIGGGFRFLYSAGEFGNTLFVPISQDINQDLGATNILIHAEGTTKVTQTSNAAANGYGYNLALTIRPFKSSDLLVAVTYRSNIALEMKGSLSAISYVDMGKMAQGTINMDADLTLGADLPPIVNIAIAKRFGKVLAEFVMETTYYGKARIFEFAYANQKFTSNLTGIGAGFVNPDEMLGAADYSAVAYGNGWKDATAYRLGLTYQHSPKLKIMGSFAYDKTPAPQGQFGIPDANAYAFGLGARYELWDGKADVGVAYSLALKDNRKSFLRSKDGLGQLQLLTFGAKYRF